VIFVVNVSMTLKPHCPFLTKIFSLVTAEQIIRQAYDNYPAYISSLSIMIISELFASCSSMRNVIAANYIDFS